MSLFRPQAIYNLGDLGPNYYDKFTFIWPTPGLYKATFTVVAGDAYNLQGVPAGTYNWTFMNGDPTAPSLYQTVQIILGNSMPPVFFGRRAVALTGIIGTMSPWQKILQWNGPGNPLTG